MSKALVLGAAALALFASAATTAMAQNGPATGGQPPVAGGAAGYPGYGYGYGYAAPLYDYAAPAYGYAATAPLYNYAAPGYGYGAVAPATGGSTIIIVTPGPAYTAPPVASGYYGAPVVWLALTGS